MHKEQYRLIEVDPRWYHFKCSVCGRECKVDIDYFWGASKWFKSDGVTVNQKYNSSISNAIPLPKKSWWRRVFRHIS